MRAVEKFLDSLDDLRPSELLALEAQHRSHEREVEDLFHGRPVGAAALFLESVHDLVAYVGALCFRHDAVDVWVDGGLAAVPKRPNVRGIDVRDEAGRVGDFHVHSDAGVAFPGADGWEVEGSLVFYVEWRIGVVSVGASVVLWDPAIVEGSTSTSRYRSDVGVV